MPKKRRQQQADSSAAPCRPSRRPSHPYLVLAAAILLPGSGQVLNNMAVRAVMMVFFIVLMGATTYNLTPPERSFIGRHSGGLFVYAMSILDAYKWARYRWAEYQVHGGRGDSYASG